MSKKRFKNDHKFGIYLYVLEFKNGKFYVGITNNPTARFDKHRSGTSSEFVNENLPIVNIQKELLKGISRSEALWMENDKTIELILKYGIERVCGGYIVGNLYGRKQKFQRYCNARKGTYKWNMHTVGNYIEVNVKNSSGIENVINIINNSYDKYVVE